MRNLRRILMGLTLLLLAACGGAPGPTPNPGGNPDDHPLPDTGSLPPDLVGDWFTGTISSIQFYNPVNGSWAPPNGEGFYFIFKADGTYEEGAVINSTQYNCTIQLLGRAVGTAEAANGKLTLHQQNRKVHVTNTCSGVGDNEVGAVDTVYTYALKNDANGNYGLFLTQSDGTPYGTFYPWGEKPAPHPSPNPEPTPDPGTLALSGTVYAPAGGDISGAIVKACYVVNDTCDPDKSPFDGIPESGSSAAFTVEGLEDLPYILMAFKDVDGDGNFFGDGDWYVELADFVTPPQSGLELRLEVIGEPEPAPELSISGTVYAPFGGDVAGTVVVACVLVADDCDEVKTQTFEITTSGESAAFTFSGLEPLSYYLLAGADRDGDGELGAGDYLSDYGGVVPPADGLDLQLVELE